MRDTVLEDIMERINGCMTAMVTPFDKDLQVDYQGLESNVEFQIANGISGLVPLGTTGEAPTITDSERTKIIETVVRKAAGRVPVIVGVGTNSTDKTIRYSKEVKDLGGDAILVVSPYYNKPTQEGLYRHFEAISNAVDLPIIVYNIAGRTAVNIETQTLARIAKLRTVVGVKEASGNIAQVMDVISQLPKDFAVVSGDDNLTLPVMAMGGKGVISVVSNLFPRMVSDMVRLAISGDAEGAKALNYKLLPIFKGAFIETSPVPIKTAMNMAGMPAGGVRLPLCEMLPHNLERLRGILSNYTELKIDSTNNP
jgi:4-hydroxy-tetrahydrodipicolinate synthase